MAWEAVGQAVGADLTPETMVPLILQSERIWMLIESFVTLVMKTRELDGRPESNKGEGQQKSHRGLRSRSRLLYKVYKRFRHFSSSHKKNICCWIN